MAIATVTIDDELLNKFDFIAMNQIRSRAFLFRQCVQQKVEKYEAENGPIEVDIIALMNFRLRKTK